MKNAFKIASLFLGGFVVLILGAGSLFAEAAGDSAAEALSHSGLAQAVKAPFKPIQALGNSMASASNGPSASEDVAVSDVFDLDAEMSG